MDFDAPTLGGVVKAVFLPYLHPCSSYLSHIQSKKFIFFPKISQTSSSGFSLPALLKSNKFSI